MATIPILRILLVAVVSRCKCDSTNGYNHGNGNTASQIGDLLKPPPLPQLSSLAPVPFRGGGRARQNVDVGFQYLPPPLPPAPPIASSTDFKFPAPFYKQYNFNFVPPPQPFATTPSPSIFQKVSGWLFPSKEVSYETGLTGTGSIAPIKKDCNPCNLVPWIPVIRYEGGSKNIQHSISPTYGPPSPTAFTSIQNIGQYTPPSLNTNNYDQRQQSFSTGVPHEVYGPPKQIKPLSNSFRSLSSTYGPPSPTHVLPILQENSITNTYSLSSNSYDLPSSSYGTPSTPTGHPSSSYSLPGSISSIPSSTYRPPTSSFVSSPYDNTPYLLSTTTYSPISPNYYPDVVNKELPSQSDVEVLEGLKPATELELPNVSSPTGFKNSYGDLITNTYALDIPYSVSATAAESNKIKTEVLPYESKKLNTPNISVALANPAPFTLNRGRNIHTLQPVALPNLSVSPLPPIFNARPFRTVSTQYSTNIGNSINFMQQATNNINVAKSVPIVEFIHSIEYPTTVIQSPIIDIGTSKSSNQTKDYRHIQNHFIIDQVKDISSQASEDHISAAKSQQDASFESTGTDFGNDLYEVGLPLGLNPNSQIPSNHKPDFADLRGVKDEDVDKYRTESNLQNIDSPLLYLKPSAPHKNYENFVTLPSPGKDNEYEIYDDIPSTTSPPQQSTLTSAWDESKTYFSDLSPPTEEEDEANHAKVIQIIVPYTTGQKDDIKSWSKDWETPQEDFLARKVQSNTENYSYSPSTSTEIYNLGITTEVPPVTISEHNDADRLNDQATPNDLYDVKEPPFDIIKLQHTIDNWTQQEYSNSKYFRMPQKVRSNEIYAKQIPDDYFTTTMNPVTNYVTGNNNYNYDFYDHEVSSSIQHTVTDNKNGSFNKPQKEYNTIERTKSEYNSGKSEIPDEFKTLHIYTAASSFRTSTTTPAPWSEVQTSISPLTKEKVYVVTSKPWHEKPKAPEYDYDTETFESKKTSTDNTASESDGLPFKSPRFSYRPSFGFTTTGTQDHFHLDTSLPSKDWHQSINDLWSRTQSEHINLFEGTEQKDITNVEEDTATPKTAVS
ncbi:uncharacterized protein [Epargyreus clarus]|uniref:uncharacterized protein n=1 Tax=Epargyreus clarus TaxID=520877 RepID=UPI003C2F0CE5